MKKVMIGLTLLLGVAAATTASAQQTRNTVQPQSATYHPHHGYQCPPGMALVQTPFQYTYWQPVGGPVWGCTVRGPFGGCRGYGWVQNYMPVTTWVPVNQCVPAAYYPVWP